MAARAQTLTETSDRSRVEKQVVAGVRRVPRQLGELVHQIADSDRRGAPVEAVARPAAVVVTPLHQVEAGTSQPRHRAVLIALAGTDAAAAAPERPPDAFGRRLELRLKPSIERFVEDPLGLTFREHAEQGIHPRLDRPLSQQIRAEAVNGADVCLFQILDGGIEPRRRDRILRPPPPDLEPLAQPQLELAGGLLGKRDGDDLADIGATRLDDAHNPLDQRGGLAGSRRGLDDERLIDGRGDQLASVLVVSGLGLASRGPGL